MTGGKRLSLLLSPFVLAAPMLMAAPAEASKLNIVGGDLGSIPSGMSNDILGPLGLPNPLQGYFGATITGSADSYKYEFLGFEASAQNAFQVDGVTPAGFSTEDYASNLETGLPLATFMSSSLDFSFLTSVTPLVVGDDSNNANVGGLDLPNYFSSFLGSDTMGKVLYLFLDDAGNEDDDNHDDLAIRITAVNAIPVPAPLGLLLASLAGLGVLSTRRRKAEA